MLQIILFLICLVTKSGFSVNLNLTSCPQNIFSGSPEFTTGDRSSRGINFIDNEHQFVQSKREPRLFSFKQDDDDVNIRMEFGVPFITIPTKRTIDGLRSFVEDAMQGEIPRPQFNAPALALIGFLCIGFSGVGILMDQFNFKQYTEGHAPFYFFNRGRAGMSETRSLEARIFLI